MPEQDTLAAVGERSEQLLRHALESVEVCQVFSAAMGVIEDTAYEKGARSIRISKAEITEKRIIAHVTFSTLTLPVTSAPLPRSAGSFLVWAAQDARRLYEFMRSNPDTIQYLGDLVRIIEGYAKHKGVKFGEVKFSEQPAPFMDQDGFLVIEIEDKAKSESWMQRVAKLGKLWK